MNCPDCTGGVDPVVLVDYADGSGGSGSVRCFRCNGTNIVSDETVQWIAEGKRIRDDRTARGLLLHAEALRLGLRPSELSRMERGYIKPYTLKFAGER